MARSRNIKPSFFTNEELVELPFVTRLMFIGLWTLADREGRMEDRPKRIKMSLFPADEVDVEKCLNELQEAKFLIRYSADNNKYIQILNFTKHQNPHVKEATSTIPAPCLHHADTMRATLIPDSPLLIPDSSSPDGDGVGLTPSPRDKTKKPKVLISTSEGFDEFWRDYPRKTGKDTAKKAWAKLKPDSETEAKIKTALAWQKLLPQWTKDDGQFIPHPATYLNQRRFDDEPPAQAPPKTMTVYGQKAAQAGQRWLENQGAIPMEKTA